MDITIICKHYTPSDSQPEAESSNDWPYAHRAGINACAKLSNKNTIIACGFNLSDQNICNEFKADRTPVAESDTERLVLIRDLSMKFSYVVEDSNGVIVRSVLATDEDSAITAFEATTVGSAVRATDVTPQKNSYILDVVGAS